MAPALIMAPNGVNECSTAHQKCPGIDLMCGIASSFLGDAQQSSGPFWGGTGVMRLRLWMRNCDGGREADDCRGHCAVPAWLTGRKLLHRS